MPRRKKFKHLKRLAADSHADTAPPNVTPASATVEIGEVVLANNSAPLTAAKLPIKKPEELVNLKIFLQFAASIIALVALVMSIKSFSIAKESLSLSQKQAEASRRYHQENVKPDVRSVVRHSSSPTENDNAMAAELVVWNNGPIKAVSLSGNYRVYVLNPTNFHVFASMGISEPLVDYSFSKPEFKPNDNYIKQILSASSPALYVVNLTYYRETDMERFNTEDYFLYYNGLYHNRDSFKTMTNYNSLMDSLLLKMECEAQGGSNKYRIVDPPSPGRVSLNMNMLNIPEIGSAEWVQEISIRTSKIIADTNNPEVYVNRGMAFHLMHKLEAAASDYERAIELGSTNTIPYCNLAVIRSTSTNIVLRNGTQAVKLAEKACNLAAWKEWTCISDLAGAYAEIGDFPSAIKYEKQALTMPGMLMLQHEKEERALDHMRQHLPIREDDGW